MPSWSNTPSGTMRAAVLTAPGAWPPSAAFTIDDAYPKPTIPGPDWLLVRVRAAGLNRAELRSRNGETPHPPEFGMFHAEYHVHPPRILGEDFVGTVEVAGAACEGFNPGDTVAGYHFGGGKAFDGAYAQYTIVHRRRLWRFDWPEEIPWATVAAVLCPMWTAYGSLFSAGDTRPGDAVLVHGATSAVGLWAVMLAKDRGCTVLATTRQVSKTGRLLAAGADHVLLEDELRHDAVRKIVPGGVRTVLELVGPDVVQEIALPALAPHGSAVCTGVLSKAWAMKDFSPLLLPPTRRLTFFTLMEEDVEHIGGVLQEYMDKVRTGAFSVDAFLDKAFVLEDVGAAHEHMEANRAVGKVVMTIA